MLKLNLIGFQRNTLILSSVFVMNSWKVLLIFDEHSGYSHHFGDIFYHVHFYFQIMPYLHYTL